MEPQLLATKLQVAVADASHNISEDEWDLATEMVSWGPLATEVRTLLAARIKSSWSSDFCSRAAEVRCAAALAASGHLTSVGWMHLRDLELPSCGDIPALARVVSSWVVLQNVTGDLGPLLANLTGTVLCMYDMELDQAATSSLVLGLQRGVKWLKLGGGARVHLHTLLSYDGNGGCVEVRCDDETADIYREEMREWAIRLNWDFGESGNGGIYLNKNKNIYLICTYYY